MRRYVGKNGFQKMNNILSQRRVRAVAGLGILTVGYLAGSNIVRPKTETKERETDREHNTHVVQYEESYVYSKIPDNNKIQAMQIGEIVEFPLNTDAYYNEENGEWVEVSVGEAKSSTMWLSGYVVDTHKEGYIPSKNVDKYKPYYTKDSAIFVVESPGNLDELEQIAIENERVWVFKDEELTNNNDIYRAIIRDRSDNLIKGYVDINSLEEDKDSDICLGTVKEGTFLRKYPFVTELDENIINGSLKNGEKVEVLGSGLHGIEEMAENWYECKVEGREESIYLLGKSLKDIKDYDKEITLKTNLQPIKSKGGTVRISLQEGDTVLVDTNDFSNGSYSVLYDSGSVCRVGYMSSKSLELYEEKEETTESKEKIVKENIEILKEQDKLTYVMDISDYTNVEEYKKVLDDLTQKDMMGGVVFRIGVTGRNNEDTNEEKVTIHNFVDDVGEFAKPKEDTVLLDDFYKQIKDKYDDKIVFSGALGSIKNLENVMEIAIDRDIPVGVYYYEGSSNMDRTSVEAAYIYSVMSKVKSDLGKKYENAKKLPYMIDVEDTSRVASKDRERIDGCINQIKLLGMGSDDPGVWCIDNIDPKEGYHLLDDYNNQFTYYGAIIRTCEVRRDSIEYMDEELSKQGYSMIYNSTRALEKGKIRYEDIMEKEDMFGYTSDQFEWYQNEYGGYDKKLENRSDLCQIFLDVPTKAEGIFKIDLSLTTKGTVNEMVNGTYKHSEQKEYLAKIENAQDEYETYLWDVDAEKAKELKDKTISNESDFEEIAEIDDSKIDIVKYRKAIANISLKEGNQKEAEKDDDRDGR